jgi:hypothetical protein
MAQRRYITLSDEAATIYDELPYGTRGDVVSALLLQQAAPPPLRYRVMAATIMEEIQRLQERLLKILEE